MSVAVWFATFHRDLRVRDTTTIATRYGLITRRLNSEFWSTTSNTSHSLYVGSYGRNTGIHSISDIDMIFELPSNLYDQYNGHYTNGQSALLQRVRSAVALSYPSSKVAADGQIVAVPFTTGPKFEIVPVFKAATGYLHPDTNNGGSWRSTNPRAEIDAVRSRNIICNKNLVPLCQMLRQWKAYCNVSMSGMLIDTLAYQFIGGWRYRDKSWLYYDFLMRDFFEYASQLSAAQSYYRAPGSAAYVYGNGFQYKAKQAHRTTLGAIEAGNRGNEWTAKNEWRKIFGGRFPA